MQRYNRIKWTSLICALLIAVLLTGLWAIANRCIPFYKIMHHEYSSIARIVPEIRTLPNPHTTDSILIANLAIPCHQDDIESIQVSSTENGKGVAVIVTNNAIIILSEPYIVEETRDPAKLAVSSFKVPTYTLVKQATAVGIHNYKQVITMSAEQYRNYMAHLTMKIGMFPNAMRIWLYEDIDKKAVLGVYDYKDAIFVGGWFGVISRPTGFMVTGIIYGKDNIAHGIALGFDPHLEIEAVEAYTAQFVASAEISEVRAVAEWMDMAASDANVLRNKLSHVSDEGN